MTLFAEKVALKLGITHWLAGEELEGEGTNAYYQAMKHFNIFLNTVFKIKAGHSFSEDVQPDFIDICFIKLFNSKKQPYAEIRQSQRRQIVSGRQL